MIILSIDGGGVRGIIPVMILEKIQELTGKEPYELFDLFTGTSTGALITAGLTMSEYGYSATYKPKDLRKFFLEETKKIFPRGNIFRDIKSIFRPEFSSSKCQDVLIGLVEGKQFNQLVKPCIIPTFDLLSNKPLFFKNREESESLWLDVLMGAIAAPTYFKPHEFDHGGKLVRCVDGGIYLNNPSLTPLFELMKHHDEYGIDRYNPEDIFILSISTGKADITRGEETDKWGLLNWIRPAMNISMRGSMETSDYGAREMLPRGHYHRIEFEIDDKHREMSDSSDENLEYLQGLVFKYFETEKFNKLIDWINEVERHRNGGYKKFHRRQP